MWRIRPILAMLFLFSGLVVPLAKAGDCDKCDCIHLPCPQDCKPCCGLLKGMIVSRKGDTLVLRSDNNLFDFKITPDTSITGDSGDVAKGRQATVYFRKSGADKLAQKVDIK
jgi:hypothetical protein